MTTLGKYRHLTQSSTTAGHFTILAIDHRANLRESLDKHAPAPISDAAFTAFKQQVMRHLLPYASAVLADPEHGLAPGIASGVISGQTGMLSPLEETHYNVHPSQQDTNFIPGWSVEKIKRMGGAGVKLLLYYHPGDEKAAAKHDLVAQIVDTCAQHDIPFFLEPILYSLDPDKPLDNVERRQVMVETARVFSAMNVDILKLEFPIDAKTESDESVWKAALDEVSAACTVPWALLSAGVSYDVFRQQAAMACQSGASGVIVGRAVWAEAVALQGAERDQFLATTACERMKELAEICAKHARDWRSITPAPEIPAHWYEQY